MERKPPVDPATDETTTVDFGAFIDAVRETELSRDDADTTEPTYHTSAVTVADWADVKAALGNDA